MKVFKKKFKKLFSTHSLSGVEIFTWAFYLSDQTLFTYRQILLFFTKQNFAWTQHERFMSQLTHTLMIAFSKELFLRIDLNQK